VKLFYLAVFHYV